MINWLLEKDIFRENLDPLKKEIIDQGMTYTTCDYIPFEGGIAFEGNPPDLDKPNFAYGSIQLLKYIKRKHPKVYTFCKFPKYRCVYYYSYFGPNLLQQEYTILPYQELKRKKWKLFQRYGESQCLFVRPDDGEKSFNGQVVSFDTWDRDLQNIELYDLNPDTLCVVATPQNIYQEWRFLVGSEFPFEESPLSIISQSCYSTNGKITENPDDQVDVEVFNFVQSIIENTKYRPDPVWVIDVGLTKNGLSIIEVGASSCCGLYGCSVKNFVEFVKEYFQEELLAI